MDTITILQDILVYVDDHIKEEIRAETLAARAGFSVWHFRRVFRWGAGYSLMEYIRARRLAFAAHELDSGRKIIDIALEYGFETHSGFSKAFRRQFGCSPETYRLHAHAGRPLLPDLSSMKQYLNGGIILEPKFVTLPAIPLAGFVLRTTAQGNENTRKIPNFWSDYMNSGKMEKLHQEQFLKNHNEYGVCFPEDPETGAFDYVIGVETKAGAAVPAGYHVCTIPPAAYAVFSTPPSNAEKFVSTIQGTWQYIFNEWFPASGYEYAPDGHDFELYDDRCMSDSEKVCEIYIPVVKKK